MSTTDPAGPRDPDQTEEHRFSLLDGYWEALQAGAAIDPAEWARAHPQDSERLGDLRLLITGTGLLVVLYALPGGFGQVMLNVRDRYLRWVAERRDIVVPSLVADKRVEGVAEHAADEAGLLEGALSEENIEREDEREKIGADA